MGLRDLCSVREVVGAGDVLTVRNLRDLALGQASKEVLGGGLLLLVLGDVELLEQVGVLVLVLGLLLGQVLLLGDVLRLRGFGFAVSRRLLLIVEL